MVEDELRFDVKEFTAEATEVPVAARVSGVTETVVRAVHFDDEPEGWGEEVGDGVAEDDLAAECDGELASRERGPKEAFGFRVGAAARVSARPEKVPASW